MHLLAELHPAPAGTPPSGSLAGWILLGVLLALVVAAGYVLSSRR